MDRTQVAIDPRLAALLACPKCRTPIRLSAGTAPCEHCGATVMLRDGVVVSEEYSRQSYFDSVFEVMREGNREEGTWRLFYRDQAAHFMKSLSPGEVVVDVGCGPDLPYQRGSALVIGVDASFESIRANRSVDLRIYASAASLPLANGSADKVVCFYSIHHMTGSRVSDHREIVDSVFREFARVLKPRGRLFVFDVSPIWPFGIAEDIVWNGARRYLGTGLDMYFWTRGHLVELGKRTLPGSSLRTQSFGRSPFESFPPVFSKPALRLPRMLYPFGICLYEWTLAGG